MEYRLQCTNSWHPHEVLEPNASSATLLLLVKSRDVKLEEKVVIKNEPEDEEYADYNQTSVDDIIKVEQNDLWYDDSNNRPLEDLMKKEEYDSTQGSLEDLMHDKCICNICGEQFLSTVHLQAHLSTHAKEVADKPSYHCPQCEKSFTSKSGLWRHAKKHTDEPAHQCTLCEKTFARKSTLQKHVETHAREQEKFVIKCEICNRPFDCKYNFERHMKIHSTKDPNMNTCDVCGKTFSNKSNLKTHMKKHMEMKTTSGTTCDEMSTLQPLPPPNDERNFKCDGCDKTFKSKHYLKEHARIHLDQNPYKCMICDKQLSCKANLMVHVRTHVRKGTTASHNEMDMYDMDMLSGNEHFNI